MPIAILHQGFTDGLSSIPYGWSIVKVASVIGVLYLLKWFFNGATNYSERNMHSKVVMVTVGLYELLIPSDANWFVGRYSWYRS